MIGELAAFELRMRFVDCERAVCIQRAETRVVQVGRHLQARFRLRKLALFGQLDAFRRRFFVGVVGLLAFVATWRWLRRWRSRRGGRGGAGARRRNARRLQQERLLCGRRLTVVVGFGARAD